MLFKLADLYCLCLLCGLSSVLSLNSYFYDMIDNSLETALKRILELFSEIMYINEANGYQIIRLIALLSVNIPLFV